MANVYKIWDKTRQKRKSVIASCLEDIKKKGKYTILTLSFLSHLNLQHAEQWLIMINTLSC